MDKSKPLKHLVFLMFFIFIVDRIGVAFYWYYTIWWFDITTHFLGGMWVGLFFIYVFYLRKPVLNQPFYVILFVFFVGVLWELFELYVFNHIGQTPFKILDTTSDIFFDLAGATLAAFYYIRGTTSSSELRYN